MLVRYEANANPSNGTVAVKVGSGTLTLGNTLDITDEEYKLLSARYVLSKVDDEEESPAVANLSMPATPQTAPTIANLAPPVVTDPNTQTEEKSENKQETPSAPNTPAQGN